MRTALSNLFAIAFLTAPALTEAQGSEARLEQLLEWREQVRPTYEEAKVWGRMPPAKLQRAWEANEAAIAKERRLLAEEAAASAPKAKPGAKPKR